jgi:hypothetical protein
VSDANIGDLMDRPRKYVLEDGVAELVMGVYGALMGGVFRMIAVEHSWVPQTISICACFAVGWGMKTLKERVTIPRGGYVALEERPVNDQVREALVIGLCIGLPVLLVALALTDWTWAGPLPDLLGRWSGVAYAAVAAGAYVWNGVRNRTGHFFWLAGFCALLGAWAWVSKSDAWLICLWQGVALTVVGGIRLGMFIRTHPKPVENEA